MDDDVAESMRALDGLPDGAFRTWIDPTEVTDLRAQFDDWPR
jgi:hypothetical protein